MKIMQPIALAVWVPLTMILFRALGPRRASLISILGGFLLLPIEQDPGIRFGLFIINKRSVTGLALLAGVLAFDPRTLIRARPRWVDIPMFAFALLPLASLAANGFAAHQGSLARVFLNFAEWAVPYLIGRLYFGDREGPGRAATGVVVAGLASVPIFGFEALMGPRWYLAGLVYGIAPHEHMVARLGGWRPEGFQTNGIEAATWLALSATLAAWLWLRGGWRPSKAPAWVPPLVLTLATLASRGVYGYANLFIGMASAVLTHFFRTRVVLVVLALLPPAYVAARVTGLWSGAELVRLTSVTGREGTVAYRLGAEDAYIKKVIEHGPLLGFGGTESAIYDYWAKGHLWADGWWVQQLQSGGVVGVSAFLLAMFLLPAGLGLALPAGRDGGASPGSIARGLTLFVLLHSLASVHNMDLINATPLLGGALVGLFLSRRESRPGSADPVDRRNPTRARSGSTPLVATAVVLIILEILGRLPRSSAPPATLLSPPTSSPVSPANGRP